MADHNLDQDTDSASQVDLDTWEAFGPGKDRHWEVVVVGHLDEVAEEVLHPSLVCLGNLEEELHWLKYWPGCWHHSRVELASCWLVISQVWPVQKEQEVQAQQFEETGV